MCCVILHNMVVAGERPPKDAVECVSENFIVGDGCEYCSQRNLYDSKIRFLTVAVISDVSLYISDAHENMRRRRLAYEYVFKKV